MLFLTLLCIWYILSGHNSLFFLSLGILSCFIISRAQKFFFNFKNLSLPFSSFVYLLFLLKEIIKSSWYVTKKIWSVNLKISPHFIKLPNTQKNSLHITILAYSVTITPGTLTVLTTKKFLHIHALTQETAEGLQELQTKFYKYIDTKPSFNF